MSKLDQKAIGARVRKARIAAGYATQAQLAEAANVTDETISRIERGAYEPALATMVDIAVALGTTIDALVGRASGAPSRPASRRLMFAADRLGDKDIELLATIAEHLGEAQGGRGKRRSRG